MRLSRPPEPTHSVKTTDALEAAIRATVTASSRTPLRSAVCRPWGGGRADVGDHRSGQHGVRPDTTRSVEVRDALHELCEGKVRPSRADSLLPPHGIGLELSIAPPRSMERHILGRAFGEPLPTLNLYLERAR